jgi:PBSX family phage terminase large subunit
VQTTKLQNQFQPIPLQQAALDLIGSTNATNILLYGGGRSGKSIVLSHIILRRAMAAPGSRHGIFRRTATACRDTLFTVAFKKAAELTFPGFLANPGNVKIVQDEMKIELHNGSTINFYGFEPHNRDRVLGNEFDTIWMNECSEFDYSDVTMLQTRLSAVSDTTTGKKLKPRFFYDLNPDLDTHFTYKCWIEKLNPARGTPLANPDDWASLQMNLEEDASHINADYLARAREGSDEEVQRFVTGYWRSEREYSLFKPSTIAKHRVQSAPALVRTIVAVDPAASSNENSDETGIVVIGVSEDGHFYVLADRSLKGSPKDWASAVSDAYDEFDADIVVAEKNQGGEMVEETLRHAAPYLPIKLVHASKGKVIRAEPISALYEQGVVHHCGAFDTLERQMYAFHSSFNRNKSGSPDRLDALVWGLSEASGKADPPRKGRSVQASGFWG